MTGRRGGRGTGVVRRFPGETKYALALGEVCVRRGDGDGAKAVLAPLADKGPGAVRGAAHYQLARLCLMARGGDALAGLRFVVASVLAGRIEIVEDAF